MSQSEDSDTEMDSQDFDNYSESLVSSSSFLHSPTSASTGSASASSSASDANVEHTSRNFTQKECPAIHQSPFPMLSHRYGAGDDCIDPRLMTSGSTSSQGWKWSETGSWTDRGQLICEETADALSPALKDARQHATNEFDTAFDEMQIAIPNSGPGVRMWLHTWLATNPDKFPNSEELKSLKTLSRLSESEIMAWLSENISIQIDSEATSSVSCIEETSRKTCTPRYRPRCRRSRRCFPHITEAQGKARTYECTHRCGQSFTQKSQWTRHERYNVEEWRCRLCGFVNARKDKLLKHLREAHNSSGTPNGSRCRQLLPPSARPCGFCLKQFSNWSAWLKHVGAHFEGHIPGGPWTMARWNRTVDQHFGSDDSDDDDEDGDDDDDQYGNDPSRKEDDYGESSADSAGKSSSKGKESSHGSGSDRSSNSSDSSKSSSSRNREARSYKRASDWLYRWHRCSTNENGEDRRFKCPVNGCRYREQGLPTEKERDRHIFDKHSANSHYYHCTYCPFKTKHESNCKQHIENNHGTQYIRDKGNFKTTSTPGQTPQTPSIQHSPSMEIPALASSRLSRVIGENSCSSKDTKVLYLDYGLSRWTILQNLDFRVNQQLPATGNDMRSKVFVLHGLGGAGKTQLAVHSAREHQDTFSAAFWLDGLSQDRVRRSIAGLARQLPNDQVSCGAIGLDLPGLISSRTGTTTGCLQGIMLNELFGAQMDSGQSLRLELNPESNNAFVLSQLKLLNNLADNVRNIHNSANPSLHLKTEPPDLRPAARPDLSSWHQDLELRTTIIGSITLRVPPGPGMMRRHSDPYTARQQCNDLQQENLPCRLSAFGHDRGNANGSLSDSDAIQPALVHGSSALLNSGHIEILPVPWVPSSPKLSQKGQPLTADDRKKPQIMGVQSCCLSCLRGKGLCGARRQRKPNGALQGHQNAFKNDSTLDHLLGEPELEWCPQLVQPELLTWYEDLKVDADSWSRKDLERWPKSPPFDWVWTSADPGCEKLLLSTSLGDENSMAGIQRLSGQDYGGSWAFSGAEALVPPGAGRGMEHLVYHNIFDLDPFVVKNVFPDTELASTPPWEHFLGKPITGDAAQEGSGVTDLRSVDFFKVEDETLAEDRPLVLLSTAERSDYLPMKKKGFRPMKKKSFPLMRKKSFCSMHFTKSSGRLRISSGWSEACLRYLREPPFLEGRPPEIHPRTRKRHGGEYSITTSNTEDVVALPFRMSGAERFVENYTQQLLPNPDFGWNDVLSAAPRALVSLGQAFVVATSAAASAQSELIDFGNMAKLLGHNNFSLHATVNPGLAPARVWKFDNVFLEEDRFMELMSVAIKSTYNRGLHNGDVSKDNLVVHLRKIHSRVVFCLYKKAGDHCGRKNSMIQIDKRVTKLGRTAVGCEHNLVPLMSTDDATADDATVDDATN